LNCKTKNPANCFNNISKWSKSAGEMWENVLTIFTKSSLYSISLYYLSPNVEPNNLSLVDVIFRSGLNLNLDLIKI